MHMDSWANHNLQFQLQLQLINNGKSFFIRKLWFISYELQHPTSHISQRYATDRTGCNANISWFLNTLLFPSFTMLNQSHHKRVIVSELSGFDRIKCYALHHFSVSFMLFGRRHQIVALQWFDRSDDIKIKLYKVLHQDVMSMKLAVYL